MSSEPSELFKFAINLSATQAGLPLPHPEVPHDYAGTLQKARRTIETIFTPEERALAFMIQANPQPQRRPHGR